MPIYEYKCSNCGHQIETLQKFSDEPLKKCLQCGKDSIEKLISAPSFRLKGSGWYETDFKTGKKKNLSEDTSKKSSVNKVTNSKNGNKQDKIT